MDEHLSLQKVVHSIASRRSFEYTKATVCNLSETLTLFAIMFHLTVPFVVLYRHPFELSEPIHYISYFH